MENNAIIKCKCLLCLVWLHLLIELCNSIIAFTENNCLVINLSFRSHCRSYFQDESNARISLIKHLHLLTIRFISVCVLAGTNVLDDSFCTVIILKYKVYRDDTGKLFGQLLVLKHKVLLFSYLIIQYKPISYIYF